MSRLSEEAGRRLIRPSPYLADSQSRQRNLWTQAVLSYCGEILQYGAGIVHDLHGTKKRGRSRGGPVAGVTDSNTPSTIHVGSRAPKPGRPWRICRQRANTTTPTPRAEVFAPARRW